MYSSSCCFVVSNLCNVERRSLWINSGLGQGYVGNSLVYVCMYVLYVFKEQDVSAIEGFFSYWTEVYPSWSCCNALMSLYVCIIDVFCGTFTPLVFSSLLLVDQTAVSHALGAVDLNLLEWVCVGTYIRMYVHMYVRTYLCVGRTVGVSEWLMCGHFQATNTHTRTSSPGQHLWVWSVPVLHTFSAYCLENRDCVN